MKLENQVCTLDQSKRLKELGVIQESFLYHIPGVFIPATLSAKQKIIFNQHWSAFTVAELGIMLPKRLKASWKHGDTTGLGGEWQSSCNCSIEYRFDVKKNAFIACYPLVASYSHPKEATARAGLLIELLERKLITAEQVNENLKVA